MRVNRREVRRIEFDNGYDGGYDGRRDRPDAPAAIGGGVPAAITAVSASARSTCRRARAGTDTGIDVRSGQTVRFQASGRVRWGPGRQDGPEGENNSPHNPNRPIPSRPAAALVGRIGDDAPFFIGTDSGADSRAVVRRLYLDDQ